MKIYKDRLTGNIVASRTSLENTGKIAKLKTGEYVNQYYAHAYKNVVEEHLPLYEKVPNELIEMELDLSQIGHWYYSSIYINGQSLVGKTISKAIKLAQINNGVMRVKCKYQTHISGMNVKQVWNGSEWIKI